MSKGRPHWLDVQATREGSWVIRWPSWRRAEQHACQFYKHGPPGGGRNSTRASSINRADLRRAEQHACRFYKHCPPGGGRNSTRAGSINIALLAEGGTARTPVL